MKQLKTYLSFINWMRNYVSYYAQLSNSFQIRKILMFKNFSIKNNARKRFSNDARLNIFIELKIESYKTIQNFFFKSTFLVYHDQTRQLYIEMNISHERDFDVIVFHIKNDKKIFIKNDIKFILFFNKILISIEFKYWSIEFEIVELIWFIKRIRHIIEIVVTISQITIYTNHSIIIDIVKQTKLSFNNINKLNFRLIRAFTYLSQYWLNVRHKSKKQYIVFDTFSRLFFNVDVDKKKVSISNSNEFENILDMIYYITLIKTFDDFKSRLKKIYRINKRWDKILKLIKSKAFLSIVTNTSIVKIFFTNITSIAR